MPAERVHTFLLDRPVGGKPRRVIVWDTQDVSVGRSPENDVVVEDSEASRQHAHFYKAEGGYAVRNLSKSNPILVNGETVPSRPLRSKDVVRVADTELIFYSVTQNPATLGLKVEYASQLKGFGPQVSGDGEATVLGLVQPVADDDFVVGAARDFENDLVAPAPAKTRDLDLELAEDGLGDLDMPAKPGVDAWAADAPRAEGALSLTLEIEGLTGAKRASLEALLGKVIELPKLRIRIKGSDLD